ncbi:MAG: hypothetical protein NTV92_08880, partial [Candidatus Bipolaricaulota bacterium]|nr:hypothetical protein [Candidatus Bipolaricaulota bacterium]
FSRVAGLNQTLQGAMAIVASPVGAALLAFLPLQAILAVDVVTALMAILPLLVLQIPSLERQAMRVAATFLRDLSEGFRFVISWRGLLATAGIAAFLNFLMAPAASLLPLLVSRHFHGTAAHFAAANMAFGVGVVAGGAILAVWGGFRRRMVTSLAAIILMGVTTLAVGSRVHAGVGRSRRHDAARAGSGGSSLGHRRTERLVPPRRRFLSSARHRRPVRPRDRAPRRARRRARRSSRIGPGSRGGRGSVVTAEPGTSRLNPKRLFGHSSLSEPQQGMTR